MCGAAGGHIYQPARGCDSWRSGGASEHVHFTPEEIASARERLHHHRMCSSVLLLDSGASKHMCNDKNMFSELVSDCIEVEFGNGFRVCVYFTKGTLVLATVGGAMELSEILLVLSLPANLFSVLHACSQGAHI